MKHVEDSDTERLIDRAFEHDRMRIHEPANTPSASLMQKLTSGAPPPVARLGLFGSAAAKWAIVLALGSATASVLYFMLGTPTTSPTLIQTPHRPDAVIERNESPTGLGTSTPSKQPMQTHSFKSLSSEVSQPSSSTISEDSLLRQQVAHPTITSALDSARLTIHR
ncbi:MAG: hypothetical protein Q8922_01615 [Bacteroidota bacterium]|nr:hypothetical protein [Bacteroidota bacterium]MDP4232075.1 hypothetical protein [Bacteroidota bacterium]MDP4241218.1 hypothetical protein [Bacteroidota bacterium]MDP4286610.1 hypothetical protein [Bacteroidota bacterium]